MGGISVMWFYGGGGRRHCSMLLKKYKKSVIRKINPFIEGGAVVVAGVVVL